MTCNKTLTPTLHLCMFFAIFFQSIQFTSALHHSLWNNSCTLHKDRDGVTLPYLDPVLTAPYVFAFWHYPTSLLHYLEWVLLEFSLQSLKVCMRLESSCCVQHVADTDIHMYAGIHLKSDGCMWGKILSCGTMLENGNERVGYAEAPMFHWVVFQKDTNTCKQHRTTGCLCDNLANGLFAA